MEFIESIKAHIRAETAYSEDMKAHLCELVDEATNVAEPEKYLANLIADINNAGEYRSRELAKWLGRVRYQYQHEVAGKYQGEEALAKLNDIVLGRR